MNCDETQFRLQKHRKQLQEQWQQQPQEQVGRRRRKLTISQQQRRDEMSDKSESEDRESTSGRSLSPPMRSPRAPRPLPYDLRSVEQRRRGNAAVVQSKVGRGVRYLQCDPRRPASREPSRLHAATAQDPISLLDREARRSDQRRRSLADQDHSAEVVHNTSHPQADRQQRSVGDLWSCHSCGIRTTATRCHLCPYSWRPENRE